MTEPRKFALMAQKRRYEAQTQNKHLAAAAPNLYKALIKITSINVNGNSDPDVMADVLYQIDQIAWAAIRSVTQEGEGDQS